MSEIFTPEQETNEFLQRFRAYMIKVIEETNKTGPGHFAEISDSKEEYVKKFGHSEMTAIFYLAGILRALSADSIAATGVQHVEVLVRSASRGADGCEKLFASWYRTVLTPLTQLGDGKGGYLPWENSENPEDSILFLVNEAKQRLLLDELPETKIIEK
ncbi:MAG: hypothetical protein Q7K39_04940 [Candidatus Magasanikbacteria bacterium]|nr:hypothetical protein [Candidatus Magasanikbacteria bacterium]